MSEKEPKCPVCGENCIYCAGEEETCENCGETLDGSETSLCDVCQEEEEENE